MDIGYILDALLGHYQFIMVVFGLFALHVYLSWIR